MTNNIGVGAGVEEEELTKWREAGQWTPLLVHPLSTQGRPHSLIHPTPPVSCVGINVSEVWVNWKGESLNKQKVGKKRNIVEEVPHKDCKT